MNNLITGYNINKDELGNLDSLQAIIFSMPKLEEECIENIAHVRELDDESETEWLYNQKTLEEIREDETELFA